MQVEQTVVLTNPHGLHARPATIFVAACNSFACDVVVIKEGIEVNGKSVMGIMMLGAEKGSTLLIRTSGEDAGPAARELARLVESGFGEGG
ncbi:MAG: HPr family phosphocarrier protein [Planctomycetota bacterium]